MNEDLFKMQMNDDISFTNIHVVNGEEIGTCSNCNIEGPTKNHVCLTVVEEYNTFETKIDNFKKNNYVELNPGQIRYINTLFDQQHIKYHRGFFKKLVNKANKNHTLSKKEYNQLMYLLRNGRSMYEDGILSTKN